MLKTVIALTIALVLGIGIGGSAVYILTRADHATLVQRLDEAQKLEQRIKSAFNEAVRDGEKWRDQAQRNSAKAGVLEKRLQDITQGLREGTANYREAVTQTQRIIRTVTETQELIRRVEGGGGDNIIKDEDN